MGSIIATRIQQFSQKFLGRPYLLGALGEGPDGQFDQFPLSRLDCFDCLTYVNTVLALALSNADNAFEKLLMQLNYYDANPLYQNRFHFMSADWNVQNQKQGLIRDISAQFGTVDHAIGDIDYPNWYRCKTEKDIRLMQSVSDEERTSRLIALQNFSKQTKKISVRMPYLPLSLLFDAQGNSRDQIFKKIPSGSVIEIVRPNWDLTKLIGTHLHVSHVGFAIRSINDSLLLRHASSVEGCVTETPLETYLRAYLQSDTVKGIAVFQPLDK